MTTLTKHKFPAPCSSGVLLCKPTLLPFCVEPPRGDDNGDEDANGKGAAGGLDGDATPTDIAITVAVGVSLWLAAISNTLSFAFYEVRIRASQ